MRGKLYSGSAAAPAAHLAAVVCWKCWGLVLKAWLYERSCGAGTHLRYLVAPAVRGRTCATFFRPSCPALLIAWLCRGMKFSILRLYRIGWDIGGGAALCAAVFH